MDKTTPEKAIKELTMVQCIYQDLMKMVVLVRVWI